MKKRVMILGAGQLQVPILEKAKERGYEIIIVSPDVNQPGIPYADFVVKADVKDQEVILRAAREYRIDGITTDQTDLPVRTAAYVADMMCLPSIGYDMGCLFTNKYMQRERCRALGIPSPRFSLTYSAEEAINSLKEIGIPAIIKPIDSQASHGVAKISNEKELKEKYQEAAAYSRDGGVLVEQWIEGTEFPVDSYVINGECTLMAIGQYNPFTLKDVFSSYKTVWPARQPESILRLIEETNKRIIEGFGLKTGRTHAEYLVSGGNCYLVEVGARGGGSFFSSDDVRYVSGISTEDFLLDFATGNELKLTVSQERHACCCTLFFYLPENGTVISNNGIDVVKELPYVRRNNLDSIHLGMTTPPVTDKGARNYIVVVAESYEQLDERVNFIQERLRIETDCGNKVLLPIWK